MVQKWLALDTRLETIVRSLGFRRVEQAWLGLAVFAPACFLLLAGVRCSESARENLLEYSCDYFAEFGYRGPGPVPLLAPPTFKLLQDGTVIVEEERAYYRGQLETRRLKKVRTKLEKSLVLRKTELYSDLEGTPILHHGGVCHFTYLDGQNRVVVAAFRKPKSRSWNRLVRYTQDLVPNDLSLFIPSEAHLRVTTPESAISEKCPDWPFKAIGLAGQERLVVTDRHVLSFLFEHSAAAEWRTAQGDQCYLLTLLKVPGWYEPYKTEKVIWSSHLDHVLESPLGSMPRLPTGKEMSQATSTGTGTSLPRKAPRSLERPASATTSTASWSRAPTPGGSPQSAWWTRSIG